MKIITVNETLLASMLVKASQAHHTYEASLGHLDADWAPWYAQWIATEVGQDTGERR